MVGFGKSRREFSIDASLGFCIPLVVEKIGIETRSRVCVVHESLARGRCPGTRGVYTLITTQLDCSYLVLAIPWTRRTV